MDTRNGVPNCRKVYIDFIKIIAIFMVLFNHTGVNGFLLFTVKRDSPLFMFYLFNAIFITMGVPMFFMSSGSLLINKEESIKKLITHRFLKYVVVLIVASVINYLFSCSVSGTQLSIRYFLEIIYSDGLNTAYWYLYAYLAYILMLPLLRRLARSMTDVEYTWMIALFGFINILSIFEYLIWKGNVIHNKNFDFFIGINYVFYPMIGYYIETRLKEKYFTRKIFLCLLGISIIAIMTCCWMTIYRCDLIGEYKGSTCQKFFSTLIFIPTITVFYGIKMMFMKHSFNNKTCKAIRAIGGTTFGIYLLEGICRYETQCIFVVLKPILFTLPACWLWIFVACCMGGGITYIIKLIPGIKKWI